MVDTIIPVQILSKLGTNHNNTVHDFRRPGLDTT
jgi:hypothetical protein